MKYYFVQHGKSLPSDVDENRPLSPEGMVETIAIAKHLSKNKIHLSLIKHSGKLRAKQTADIIAYENGLDSTDKSEGMKPNDDAVAFSNAVLSSNNDDVLYVGHLPQLQKAISYLLSKDETSNSIKFQNSAVVCIEVDDTNTHIAWYLTPDSI